MADDSPHNQFLRHDRFSGRETIFAASRRHRPHHISTGAAADEMSQDCPFCPGNERLLTSITWQLGHGEAWRTRVVPNLYPLVTPPAGYHEVIIDAPRHRLPAVEMAAENWHDLLATYSARYHALAADWRYVTADGVQHVGKLKSGWVGEWRDMGVAFRWTLLPEAQTFQVGDWGQ